MEAERLWVQAQVKSHEKCIFALYVFFHIWVYLIIDNKNVHCDLNFADTSLSEQYLMCALVSVILQAPGNPGESDTMLWTYPDDSETECL